MPITSLMALIRQLVGGVAIRKIYRFYYANDRLLSIYL